MKASIVLVVLKLLLLELSVANNPNTTLIMNKEEEESRSYQSILLKRLLAKCDPLVVPVKNGSLRIQVWMSYALMSIIGLNAQDQTLQTLSYLVISWQDNLFTWNPHENMPNDVYIRNKNIWIPPLLVANAVEDKLGDSMASGLSNIRSDGQIYTTPILRVKTICSVDISRFPFDTQICEIRVGSVSKYVKIDTIPEPEKHLFEKSNEWELLNLTFNTVSVSGQDSRGGVIIFILRRRWFFYLIKSIIPSYALSLINAFVFLLPAQSGERMTMSISSFLSYAIYVTYIHESLPTNSDTNCYFLVYLCAMMVVCVGIILVSVISLELHKKASEGEVPYWLRRILGGKNMVAIEKNDKSSIVPSKAMSIDISKRFDKCCFIAFFTSTVVTTVTLTVLFTT